MHFAILTPNKTVREKWQRALSRIVPEARIQTEPSFSDPETVTAVLVWRHPPGSLQQFKNLKFIFSMGAGVDHIFEDEQIPRNIPIARIVDPGMAFSMSNFILMAVLNHHKNWYQYWEDQQNKVWNQYVYAELPVRIGILGIGFLGMDVALKLHQLGFSTFGYSMAKKDTPFLSFWGDALPEFLSKINVLVCTVPYTPKTQRLLSKSLFDMLSEPTYLINVSRGGVHVENDILKALESGQLSGAFLDVFEKEPLPKDSPIWHHPKIKMTPHIASITTPSEGARQFVENYKCLQKGLPLLNTVSWGKMY